MSFDEHTRTDDLSLFGNADPFIGKVLNARWQVQEFLGEGSMSAVYKALDTITDEPVVIKILHQHLVTNAKNLKRFEQKAKAATSLIHPCIAHMLAFNLSAEGEIFLVVEFLQGESLEDLLAKTGHLSIEQSIGIFKQACDGLEFAHQQDVFHRDLKPSNIMLLDTTRPNDDVKLVDFGIAKLLSDETDDVKTSGYITRSREVFGSPMYMSPEQCMGRRLDARSDIYSLGCVMYETLTGKPPFVGKNVLETAYKHMNEKPKSITADTVASRAMNRMESIIFRCLEKDPNLRYQTMAQLKSDLEILLRASDIEWNASAIALRKAIKVQKKSQRRSSSIAGGIKSRVTKEAAIITALGATFLFGLGIWGVSFISSDNYSGPSFDDNTLWLMDKTPPREEPNYAARLSAAEKDLKRIEQENGPQSTQYEEALLNVVKVCMRSGHFADAEDYCNSAVKMAENPDLYNTSFDVYLARSYVEFFLEKYDDAERDASTAIERGKERGMNGTIAMAMPLNICGEVYSRRKELDKAADAYDNLYALFKPLQMERTADFVSTAVRLADIYRRQPNKSVDAERLYKTATDAISGLTEGSVALKAHYGLGLVLEQENKLSEALQNFQYANTLSKKLVSLGNKQGMLQAPKPELVASIKRHLDSCQWRTNFFEAIMAKLGWSKAADSQQAQPQQAPQPLPR